MTVRPSPRVAAYTPRRTRVVASLLVACVVTVLVVPAAVHAQPAPLLSTTVSGGGTKGAHMGGQLYYASLVNRLTGAFEPGVFTGTSAGALNSLMALLTECDSASTGRPENPKESLYWQAWTTVGLTQLFDPSGTDPAGIMTMRAYDPILARMRGVWEGGFEPGCGAVLGFAVTRTEPELVDLGDRLPPLPRSRGEVALRIQGGEDGTPRVANHLLPGDAGQLLLPAPDGAALPFDSVARYVLASSAYPLGFPPLTLRYCLRGAAPAVTTCSAARVRTARFMDGGVFENQPLDLAIEAVRALDSTSVTDRYLYIDPRVRAYPIPPLVKPDTTRREDALSVAASLLGLPASAEASELFWTFEHQRAVVDRLYLARTYLPPASSTFSGLLETSFREFDFYLGMYDAARSIREGWIGLPVLDSLGYAGDAALLAAWQPYRCLRAVLDELDDEDDCLGDELADFRILLQVSIDRLTQYCYRNDHGTGQAAAAGGGADDFPQCGWATGGPRRVPGVPELMAQDTLQQAHQSDLDHFLHLLGLYGFHFRDLGLSPAQSMEAPEQVIRVAKRIVQHFSDIQPQHGQAIGVGLQAAVDEGLGYVPPLRSAHVSLGVGAELGYSVAFGERGVWDRIRASAALGLDGLPTLLSSTRDYLAFIPKAGVEVEAVAGSTAQLRVGARVGYQLSNADDFTRGDCDFSQEASRPCSRLFTELFTAVTLLELLRLQVAGVYEPGSSGRSAYWAVRPAIGLQFGTRY